MEMVHVWGASLAGCQAHLVRVEARFEAHEKGRTEIHITGLPDPILRESRMRLVAALRANRMALGSGELHLHLLPAALPKVGEGLDLPLLIAAAACRGHLRCKRLDRILFVGEVGIDGSLHGVRGGLAAAEAARAAGLVEMLAPGASAEEAACLPDLQVYAAEHVSQVLAHLTRVPSPLPRCHPPPEDGLAPGGPSLAEVRGQELAKFALTVCAAGGHRLLLVGPPGTGKSMLAARLPGLLPPPTLEERLEMTRILSACRRWPGRLVARRPFRAPHHSASLAGMVGGGPQLHPGELSLAHGGVLFLDELPEFRREVLESLRGPLEGGLVTLSRAGQQVTLPARVHLVAAMNPCPCGFHGHPGGRCRCGPGAIRRYLGRISGPLLDRFDVRIDVQASEVDELLASGPKIRAPEPDWPARVLAARSFRQARGQMVDNASLSTAQLHEVARPVGEARQLLGTLHQHAALSSRSLQSLRRVARTLADLDGSETLAADHVARAISLRSSAILDPLPGA